MQKINLIAAFAMSVAFASTGFSMEDDSSLSIVPVTNDVESNDLELLVEAFLNDKSNFLTTAVEDLNCVILKTLSDNNIKLESPQEKLAWWLTFEALVLGAHMSALSFVVNKFDGDLNKIQKEVLLNIGTNYVWCHSCRNQIVYDSLHRLVLSAENKTGPIRTLFFRPNFNSCWLNAPVLSRSCSNCIKANRDQIAAFKSKVLRDAPLRPWVIAGVSAWTCAWDYFSKSFNNEKHLLEAVSAVSEFMQLQILKRDTNELVISVYQSLLASVDETTYAQVDQLMNNVYLTKLDENHSQFLTPWRPRTFPSVFERSWQNARVFLAGEKEDFSAQSIVPYLPHDVVLLILRTYFEVVRDSYVR